MATLISQVQYLAKQLYGKYKDKELYFGNPLLDFAKKTTDFTGIDKEIPADTSLGGGVASRIGDAVLQHTAAGGVKFKVPQATLHGFVTMEAKVLRNASESGDNARFIDYAKKQHLDAHQSLMQEVEFLGHGGGYGVRATVLSASGDTIMVAPWQAQFFSPKKLLRASATPGSALVSGTPVGSDPAGSARIVSVNTSTGAIKVNGTVTTQITGIGTPGMSLYQLGVANDNGNGAPVLLGIDAWNPQTVTATLFCNVDRTENANALGGCRYTAGGARETLLIRARAQAQTDLPNQWKDGGIVLLHPLQFAEYECAKEGVKEITDAKSYEMGIRKIMYRGQVLAESRNCPIDWAFVLGPDSAEFSTCGKAPKILDPFEAPDSDEVKAKLVLDGNWIFTPSRMQRVQHPVPA